MRDEKPPKRLVHMEQYLNTMGKKSALYSSATVLGSAGSVLLLAAVVLSWASFHAPMTEVARFLWSLVNGVLGISACGALWGAFTVFHKAHRIETVAPITKYNVSQLPVSEILVRASDRPLTEQEMELLRPATQGQETPPEQLLRATTPTDRLLEVAISPNVKR